MYLFYLILDTLRGGRYLVAHLYHLPQLVYLFLPKHNNIKITDEIEKFILNSISKFNTPLSNIKNIKKNINKNYNIYVSKQTIYNIFYKNNLTYKQLKVKNMPYSCDKLIELKKQLRDKIKPVFNNLNSYDEMAIYLNDTPTRGWSIKGTDCIIKTKKSLIKKRYTIGMNIDINSDIDFTLIEGSLKQDKLISFYNKLNKKKLKIEHFLWIMLLFIKVIR